MTALVVYESLWGNTAAIAHAVAEGIGPGTRVAHTGEADPAEAATVDLLVIGAPVHAFGLPTSGTKASVATRHLAPGDLEPELNQPPVRDWLARIESGTGIAAAFDTRVRGPLGRGGASKIEKLLESKGFRVAHVSQGFLIANEKNPKSPASMLREGEIERAREWGAKLAVLAS
jgi:flavodoxin